MPGVGLEPTRVFTQRILSPLRLPVSSPRRDLTEHIICSTGEDLKRGEIPSATKSSGFENHSLRLAVRAILLPRTEARKQISGHQCRPDRTRGL